MVNSLLPVRVPLMAMLEGEPTSNGRVQPPVERFITPGARFDSMMGLPSLSGNSRMRRLSTTCPIEAVEVSTSGASAVTRTVSDAWPISSATFSVARSFTWTLIPS